MFSNKSLPVRLASSSDEANVALLLATGTPPYLFAPVVAADAIALSATAVIAEETHGSSKAEPVGFAAVTFLSRGVDLPALLAALSRDAPSGTVLTPGNTGVLVALSVSPGAASQPADVSAALLRAIFERLPELDQLLVLAPASAGVARYDDLLANSPFVGSARLTRVPAPLVGGAARAVYTLQRGATVPPLFVRPARVEDHDDLVPIFASQSEVLPERFGTFFVAEAIGTAAGPRKVLVAEGPTGNAVGMIAATSEVPLALLRDCFELDSFGGLAQPSVELEEAAVRAAALQSRTRADWLSVMQAHASALAGLLSALPAAPEAADAVGGSAQLHAAAELLRTVSGYDIWDEQQAADKSSDADTAWLDVLVDGSGQDSFVRLGDVRAVLDAQGDAWGFEDASGARLGCVCLSDLDITASSSANPDPVISRSELIAALRRYVRARNAAERRARLAAWYLHSPLEGVDGADADGVSATPAHTRFEYGRRIVLEMLFDPLAVNIEASKRERLRNCQVANSAAQKELDAASAAERAAREATLKDGEGSTKKATPAAVAGAVAAAAGDKRASASLMTRQASFPSIASPPPFASPAVSVAVAARVSAEVRAEEAAAAQLQAQAALSQAVQVPLPVLASSLQRALPSFLRSSNDIGAEFVSELTPFLVIVQQASNDGAAASKAAAEALPLPVSQQRQPSSRNLLMPSGGGMLAAVAEYDEESVSAESASSPIAISTAATIVSATRQELSAALALLEKSSLALAASPVIAVSGSGSMGAPLCVLPADASLSTPTVEEAAVASAAVSLLSANGGARAARAPRVPCFHLPEVLSQAVVAYAAATAEAESTAAAAVAEEEKRRVAEGKAAKEKRKDAAAGEKSHAVAEPVDTGPGKAAIAAASAAAALSVLIDPHVDPAGAAAAFIASLRGDGGDEDVTRGCVITGIPSHDVLACTRLAQAFSGVGLPFALHLYAVASDDDVIKQGDGRGAMGEVQPSVAKEFERIPCSGKFGALVHIAANACALQERAARRGEDPDVGLAQLILPQLSGVLMRCSLLDADPLLPPRKSEDCAISVPDCSAFAITLFCLDTPSESRAIELLAGAFEAFPSLPYAVLTQPHASPSDTPLLRYFTQVPHTPASTLDSTLFICHRDSLLAPTFMDVRRAVSSDRSALLALAQTLPPNGGAASLMESVIASEYRAHLPLEGGESLSPARIACFVAEVQGQIVGVAVLSNTGASARAIAAITISYRAQALPLSLPSHVAACNGGGVTGETGVASLLHCILDPTFVTSGAHFLRQALAAYGGKTALIYRHHCTRTVSPFIPPLVLSACVPLEPCRLPEPTPAQCAARAIERELDLVTFDLPAGVLDPVTAAAHVLCDGAYTEADLVDARGLDHALYVFTPRLGALPTRVCNERVLVVGTSDAALAAVQGLLFPSLPPGAVTARLRLPHITIVAPGGFPTVADVFTLPASFMPARAFSNFELARLPLYAHVRVVDDSIASISRKNTTVTLSGGGLVRYDRLILLPGLTEPTWSTLGFAAPEEMPRGCHCLSLAATREEDPLAADVSMIAQRHLARQQHRGSDDDASDVDRVLVYGDSLEAITAVAALLDRGIPGSSITLLRPSRSEPTLPSPSALAGALDAAGANGEAMAEGVTPSMLASALLPRTGGPVSPASLFPALAVHSILTSLGVRQFVGATLLSVANEASPAYVRAEFALTPPSPLDSAPARDGFEEEEGRGFDRRGRGAQRHDVHSEEEEDTPDFNGSVAVSIEAGDGVGAGGGGGGGGGGTTSTEWLSLAASLLICADTRAVDARFFTAINDSGIVFDGRLVVDADWRATDARVFGGGASSKFSRRYRNALNLAAFDAREMGASVASSVLRSLDGGRRGECERVEGLGDVSALTLPQLSRPHITRCLLPGGLLYVSSRLPAYETGATGREVVTRTQQQAEGTGLKHTRVVLCRYGRFAELCYVGSDMVESANLGGLVGLHGAFLNGLARRADALAAGHVAAGIPGGDIITFFREQWASALHHEDFPALASALSDALLEGSDPAVPALAAQLNSMLQGAVGEDEEVAAIVDAACADATAEAVGVGGRNLGSGARSVVEGVLRGWLERQTALLPEYGL